MKWPRQHLQEIMGLTSREERVKALQEVPEQYRELVRTYLNIQVERNKWKNVI